MDPISEGRNRSRLDALLRDISSRGIWVSAHPDVILNMGVKEVLYQTRHFGRCVWSDDSCQPRQGFGSEPSALAGQYLSGSDITAQNLASLTYFRARVDRWSPQNKDPLRPPIEMFSRVRKSVLKRLGGLPAWGDRITQCTRPSDPIQVDADRIRPEIDTIFRTLIKFRRRSRESTGVHCG